MPAASGKFAIGAGVRGPKSIVRTPQKPHRVLLILAALASSSLRCSHAWCARRGGTMAASPELLDGLSL